MNQRDQIANHLKRHGSITPLHALSKYQIFRLAARVNELRNQGMEIETETVKKGGKRYARYRHNQTNG